MKQDDIWDTCADIIETCRMNLTDLRELVRTALEVREVGSCQCGDDEACKFVRERDELRGLVTHMIPWMMRTTPPALIEAARAARDAKRTVELGDGWVRTKDLLPDYGVAVLTVTECEGLQVLSLSTTARSREWVGMGHLSWRLEEVTHWMPLPNPPKDEE